MPFKTTCPKCSKTLQVPDAAIGKQVKCSGCQHVWLIAKSPLAPEAIATAPPTQTPVAAFRSNDLFDEMMNDSLPATAKPTAGAVSASPPRIKSEGIWQDDGQLVVAVRGPHFPAICVKTGQPNSGKTTRVELTWVPNQVFWAVMFGAIGHAIAKKTTGKKLTLDVPVASQWLKRQRKKRLAGRATVAGGVLWIILGIIANVVALGSGVPEARTYWMLPAAMFGIVIALGGAVFLMTGCGAILTVRKMTDRYAWIAGAHAKFLEQLPNWDRG